MGMGVMCECVRACVRACVCVCVGGVDGGRDGVVERGLKGVGGGRGALSLSAQNVTKGSEATKFGRLFRRVTRAQDAVGEFPAWHSPRERQSFNLLLFFFFFFFVSREGRLYPLQICRFICIDSSENQHKSLCGGVLTYDLRD